MKKWFLTICMLLCGAARAGDSNTGLSGLTLTTLTDSTAVLATFSPDHDNIINSISLYAGKSASTAFQLRATIMGDVAGSPDCASSPMYAVAPSGVSTTAGWVSLTCIDGCYPTILSGQTYWLVAYDLEDANTAQYQIGLNDNDTYQAYVSTDSNVCQLGNPLSGGFLFVTGPLPTQTVSTSPTNSPSPVPGSPTISPTFSVSPTATRTASPTRTSSPTPTWTPTATPTGTPRNTQTFTKTASPTFSFSVTKTQTQPPTPRPSNTASQTFTVSPTMVPDTDTFTVSPTKSPSFTLSPTKTIFVSATRTFTFSPTAQNTWTFTKTFTISPTFTATRTTSPTRTASPTPTASPTSSPTKTFTLTPVNTPTFTPAPGACYQFVTLTTDAINFNNLLGLTNSYDNTGIWGARNDGSGLIIEFGYDGSFIQSFSAMDSYNYQLAQNSTFGDFFVTTGGSTAREYNLTGAYVQDIPVCGTNDYSAGVAVDPAGNVYVAEECGIGDGSVALVKFNPSLTPIATFVRTHASMYFEGVAYCADCGPGNIPVIYADSPCGCPDGNMVRILAASDLHEIGSFAPSNAGFGNGQIDYPQSIVVSPTDFVLVSDWSSVDPYVNVYDKTGKYITRFQDPGGFSASGPVGLAFAPDNTLWISDDKNTGNIYKFVDCLLGPSPTETPTATPTVTQTSTVTPRFSRTITPTSSPVITFFGSPTITPTAQNSFTVSPTMTKTPVSISGTSTVTNTPRSSFTASPSFTISATPTDTPTLTSTLTASFTFSLTSTKTLTVTPSSTLTRTTSFTTTKTFTLTSTITETFSVSPSITPSRTVTGTPTPSSTATATPQHGDVMAQYPATDGVVYSMALNGSTLYIGGSFSHLIPVSGPTVVCNNIAAIDAISGAIEPWHPTITGGTTTPVVNAITITANTVYVGGIFATVGTTPVARQNLAAINGYNSGLTAGQATSWNPTPDDVVRTIYSNGTTVYVGGDFTHIVSAARNMVAAVNVGGTLTTWNPGSGATITHVYSIAPVSAGLLIGGDFSSLGGQLRNNAAIIPSTVPTATSWDANVAGPVFKVGSNGTQAFLAGSFATVHSATRNNFAAVKLFDGTVQSFDPEPDGPVYGMSVDSTQIFMAGAFSNEGGQARVGFGAGNLTFSTATPWTSDAGGGASTGYTMLETPWAIFIGGDFTTINGVSQKGFAGTVP